MKLASPLYRIILLVGAVALAASANASPVVHTISFDELIVFESDTFETSGGTALFTTNGVGYNEWLSPNIAADLAADPLVPSQVQSTASLLAMVSEYQFLSGQGPNYLVLGGVGPATLDPFADQDIGFDVGNALAAAGGLGYSVVGGNNLEHIVNVSYTTGAIEPDGSLIDGTVTFDIFQESIVEQPVAAAPEPSTLALLGSGLAFLLASKKFTRRSILILAAAIALATTAHATPMVNTVAFTETLIVGTDTFETAGGTPLFIITGVGYSDSLSPIIASDFASNAPCDFCYSVPAGSPLPAQIQSTASLIPQLSEYDFLTEVTPDYVVVGGVGPAIAFPGGVSDSPTDFINSLVTTGGPGYSITGTPTATGIGNWSFDTGGFAPDGSLLEGTVTFDVFELDIVEQPIAATPEPSTIALFGSGLLLLGLGRGRKHAGSSR